MANAKRIGNRIGNSIWDHVGKVFVAGILVVAPLLVTYLILRLLFNVIDDALQPFASRIFQHRIPGLGIGLLLFLLYFAGLLSLNVLGKRLVGFGHDAFSKTPFIRAVYSTAKGVTESIFGEQARSFKRVVLIEYPAKDIWAMGFLTALSHDEKGNALAFVYIPHPPTPQSGWLAIFPLQDVRETNMTVQDAMRLIFSVGTIVPVTIRTKAFTLDKAGELEGKSASDFGNPQPMPPSPQP